MYQIGVEIVTREEIEELIDNLSAEEFTYALAIAKAYDELEKDYSNLQKQYDTLFVDYINRMDKKEFAKFCGISRPYLDKLLNSGMKRDGIYEYCMLRKRVIDANDNK